MGWEIVVQGRDDVFHHSDYVETTATGNSSGSLTIILLSAHEKNLKRMIIILAKHGRLLARHRILVFMEKKYAQIIGNNQLSHVLL